MKPRYVLKSIKVYGISVINEKGGETEEIYLIDRDKKEIRNFIKLCNAERLEPVHLRNAIDDML